MPSQEEFESISQTIYDILDETSKAAREKEEEALHKEMQAMIVEYEQEILNQKQKESNKGTSPPPKSKISPMPVSVTHGYFIAVGTDIMIPVDWPTGKKVMAITDFITIATTKDVRYDLDELMFDREQNLSELPANIGIWADEMMGFRLPPNNKDVEFFLVKKCWVDILQDIGYNDRMGKWLHEVLKQTSDSMDMSSILRGI